MWVKPIHILAALMQMNNVNAWESPTQVVKVKEYWMEMFDWWYDGVVRERWKRKLMSFAIWFCQNPPHPPGHIFCWISNRTFTFANEYCNISQKKFIFLLQIDRTLCFCEMLQTKQAPQQKKWSGSTICKRSDMEQQLQKMGSRTTICNTSDLEQSLQKMGSRTTICKTSALEQKIAKEVTQKTICNKGE